MEVALIAAVVTMAVVILVLVLFRTVGQSGGLNQRLDHLN